MNENLLFKCYQKYRGKNGLFDAVYVYQQENNKCWVLKISKINKNRITIDTGKILSVYNLIFNSKYQISKSDFDVLLWINIRDIEWTFLSSDKSLNF